MVRPKDYHQETGLTIGILWRQTGMGMEKRIHIRHRNSPWYLCHSMLKFYFACSKEHHLCNTESHNRHLHFHSRFARCSKSCLSCNNLDHIPSGILLCSNILGKYKVDDLRGNICSLDPLVYSIFHPLDNNKLRRPHRRRLHNVPSTTHFVFAQQRENLHFVLRPSCSYCAWPPFRPN